MKLLLIVFAIIGLVLGQDYTHQMLSLDSMVPSQLSGLLKGDWKSLLATEVQKQISSFKMPWHQ